MSEEVGFASYEALGVAENTSKGMFSFNHYGGNYRESRVYIIIISLNPFAGNK
jgi:hypothetical protein